MASPQAMDPSHNGDIATVPDLDDGVEVRQVSLSLFFLNPQANSFGAITHATAHHRTLEKNNSLQTCGKGEYHQFNCARGNVDRVDVNGQSVPGEWRSKGYGSARAT